MQTATSAQLDPSSIAVQWDIVTQAPLIFGLAVLATGGVIWAAIRWAYQSRLASKDGQIDLLKAQLESATYKKGYEDAAPEKAAETIKQLEMRLAAVEPRRLTQDQKQAIGKYIRKHAGMKGSLTIIHDGASADAKRYAEELTVVLSQYQGIKIKSGMVLGPSVIPASGIQLTARDASSDVARFVTGVLDAADIDYDADLNQPQDGFVDATILITNKTT